MSALPRPRPLLSDLLWAALLTVALHAFLRTYAPGSGLATTLLAYAAVGALLQPGLRFLPANGRRVTASLLGAALLGACGLACLVLDPLAEALGGLWWSDGALLLAGTLVALIVGGSGARLWVLTRVEALKLRRGFGLKGGLLVATAMALYVGWSTDLLTGQSGWTAAERALGAGLLCAEMLLLVLGATAVSAEAAQGTLKMILPHAYRRGEWVAAKALVLSALALVFAVLLGGATYLQADLLHGLGDVIKPADELFGMEESVHRTAETMRGHFVASYWAAVAVLVASALTGLFVSCLFAGVIPSLSAAFIAFATVHLGRTLLGFGTELEERLFAEYPQRMLRLMGQIGSGYDDAWNPALLTNALALSGSLCIVAVLAGMRLFARRDYA